jgi:histidine ammonia-lyase
LRTIMLNGEQLSLELVDEVAHAAPGGLHLQLAPAARLRVERAANAVQSLITEGVIAYGITTGFGAFKNKIIAHDQVETLQRNILMSHAVGVGEPLDTPTTRALMLIRANTLASGYSGIRAGTLDALLALLNHHIHPVVPRKGSLGASGDLAPLAHMALPLIGLGEAVAGGVRIPGAEALAGAGLQPVTLAAKEGLALTNGTSLMTALGVLQTLRAEHLSRIADVTAALSLEALNGTPLAFDERLHQLRPFPRQIACAAHLRALLAGSDFTRGYDPTNVQDAYTLRCIPQVHGAIRDAIAYARWVFAIELNAVTDNPLLFIDEAAAAQAEAAGRRLPAAAVTVISGGNFHGEPLAIALDYLAIAMAELGNIAERRLMRLTDEASNAHVLPAFLTKEGGLNSGFMITQYTAAALATENKVLAHPASVDTIPTSANVEDHVSMGVTAALKLGQLLDNVEQILALELLAAAQAIDLRRETLPPGAQLGSGTAPLYTRVRAVAPFLTEDAVMYPLIEAVRTLVAERTTG